MQGGALLEPLPQVVVNVRDREVGHGLPLRCFRRKCSQSHPIIILTGRHPSRRSSTGNAAVGPDAHMPGQIGKVQGPRARGRHQRVALLVRPLSVAAVAGICTGRESGAARFAYGTLRAVALPQLRRVCKIALHGRATWHGICGDFAHAVGLPDRLLPEAARDLGHIATPVGRQ